MDLMFDSMPLIYDMIDDDMRMMAMRCNGSSQSGTPGSTTSCFSNASTNAQLNTFDFNQFCLTDDEQLALTSCMLDDFSTFFPPSTSCSTTTTSSAATTPNDFQSLQNSFDINSLNSSCSSSFSSLSSSSSSSSSSCSSSPLSSSSSSSIPSSIYDDLNQYSITKYTTQDSYLSNNNNNSTNANTTTGANSTQYQVINPLELNSHHQNDLQQGQSSSSSYQLYIENTDHNLYHKQPSTTTTILRPALKAPATLYTQLNSKRSKFSHDSSLSQHQQQQQQQYIQITTTNGNNSNISNGLLLLNSDGESTISNESDSNESVDYHNRSKSTSASSSVLNSPIHVVQHHQTTSGKDVITSLLNNNNNTHNSTQGGNINIIKLDKNHDNTKHIIHYKQIINNSTNTKTGLLTPTTTSANPLSNANRGVEKVFPKPPYSYSCLIAMALRNSDSGTLPVSDIYEFIIENFPYYKTARDGWKNSIRHNLSLNKCFEKIENPANGSKKGCLWALNPDKCKKLEEECKRCRQRDIVNIRLSMSRPDDLSKIERGEQRIKKCHTNQRKLVDHANTATTTTTSIATTATTNGATIFNGENKFLIDWTNKTTTSPITTITANKCNQFVKENDQQSSYHLTKLEKSNININITPTTSLLSDVITNTSKNTIIAANDVNSNNSNNNKDSDIIKIEIDF